MQIITINLPERYLIVIQILEDLGISPSRSETVRRALREFLENELNFFEDLESDNFKELMRGVQH